MQGTYDEKLQPPASDVENVQIDKAIVHGCPQAKRILGIKAKYCLYAFVFLIVISLALGLGLGLGLKNKSHKTSASTPQPTSSPSTTTTRSSSDSAIPTAVTSGTHGLAENSCKFQTPRTYESRVGGAKFTQYCFTDWPRNGDSADGDGKVHDLNAITTYTFEACMDECAKMNQKHTGTPLCQAISYNANLTASVELGEDRANCYLKTKKGVNHQGTAESACAALVF